MRWIRDYTGYIAGLILLLCFVVYAVWEIVYTINNTPERHDEFVIIDKSDDKWWIGYDVTKNQFNCKFLDMNKNKEIYLMGDFDTVRVDSDKDVDKIVSGYGLDKKRQQN